jgi:hypothetical protein
MRIGILDVGGNFFGCSWGLTRLGHQVHYCPVGVAPYLEELGKQLFEWRETPDTEVDLFVYAASFVDETWTLDAGIRPDAPVDPRQPLLPSIHPDQALIRRRWLEENLQLRCPLVLVDLSDNDYYQDPWFEQQDVLRLRRELATWRDSDGVLPFPWLYQPSLLWCEIVHGFESLLIHPDQKQQRQELLFAGTVDHWRYRGSRQRALRQLRSRYPEWSLRVESQTPLLSVWEQLQQAYAGIYLHGHGQICFRLHELCALAVPALAPELFDVQVPEPWKRILASEIEDLATPNEMFRFYLEEYHPVRAAAALLRAAGAVEEASLLRTEALSAR